MSEDSFDEIECNCGCIDYIDAFWDKYKYKIASPLSVTLSVCGAASGLLVPHFAIASSVAITITNVSIFFTSILLTKYMTENKHLNTDNISLKNENKRLTVIHLSNTQNNNTKLMPLEIRLFFITLVMSFVSVMCHVLSSISTFILIRHDLDTTFIYLIIIVAISSALFKQASNFFIFVIFDSNFRSTLMEFLKI